MKMLYPNPRQNLLVIFIVLGPSCSKKSEPAPLDQYVGSWAEVMSNLILIDFLANSIVATVSGAGFQADNKNIATGQGYQHPDYSVSELFYRT